MLDHPLFHKRPDRVYAWLWMLETAAWKTCRQDVGGVSVTVGRGELCASQAMISDATGMSRQEVRTLLERLKEEGAVKTRTAANLTKGRTILTICNYEKYQAAPQADNQAATKQQPTKEQGNNTSNEDSAENGASDIRKQVWSLGVQVLASAGLKERPARSLLGKWIKANGEGDVIAALLDGQDRADPVAFIEARFKRRNSDPCEIWGVKPDEDDGGNFSRGGDNLPPAPRDATGNLPRVLAFPAQEKQPVHERDVRDRPDIDALPSLRFVAGALV